MISPVKLFNLHAKAALSSSEIANHPVLSGATRSQVVERSQRLFESCNSDVVAIANDPLILWSTKTKGTGKPMGKLDTVIELLKDMIAVRWSEIIQGKKYNQSAKIANGKVTLEKYVDDGGKITKAYVVANSKNGEMSCALNSGVNGSEYFKWVDGKLEQNLTYKN